MSIIALMGAGGKIGYRIARNLKDNPNYTTLYVEISNAGITRLAELGLSVTPQDEALEQADVVILAVPDALIGKICKEIVPKLKSGTMVMELDPAAAYAGVLPKREDITYFITHPCHPPLFHDETEPEARQDFYGGVKAKQHIVCSLHHGPEEAYTRGEEIARAIFAPVMRAHQLTMEQMVILEPALVETVLATCITVLREAMDKAVLMGVPEQAARDFFFGHVRAEMAGVFDVADITLSDGAKLAISQAKKQIFQPDWQKVMEIDSVRKSVKEITGAPITE